MFNKLAGLLEGEFYTDYLTQVLYATDASPYREMPVAVAIPKTITDIERLVAFANEYRIPLIPRGAGTSLAGQVVGSGLVIDQSKYLNRIVEINAEERWVRVEPGVVLAELNLALKPFGLQFGPETSTANRCTMGGMLGNNSCGLHSLVHGSVREHVLETEVILSDNSKAIFKPLTTDEFNLKCNLPSLEGELYRSINEILSSPANRKEINAQYPHPSVPRRNHGYALDILAQMQPFNPDGELFNFSKLIAGSEGTLAFVTSMKLELEPLPPQHKALLCVHFSTLAESFRANLIGLKYHPSAIELMDKTIMDLTKGNIGLARNRFFIEGEPEALLIIELWGESKSQIEETAAQIEAEMRANGYGFHFPLVWGDDIPRAWALRTAGLGVLANMSGDAKPVSVIEDTAVPVHLLPDYMADFNRLMKRMELEAVHHAHIATGELHLRPILNLKDKGDVAKFKTVAIETAKLVKKYRGSLSGEHGDGRLRGEFIPFMLGEKVYSLLKELKKSWDPHNLFNPGKITDTPAMDQSLRFEPGQETQLFPTYFDYKLEQGYARAIEKCNGSGDCRKSEIIGGTMCPSFMATRDELHSTRGRANVLRELITRPAQLNWADQQEILDSLNLCLSCKACKSECPSGVDMAKLKAEFLQNHYDGNPLPLRSRIIAYFPFIMQIAQKLNPLSGWVMKFGPTAKTIQYLSGFTTKIPLPWLSKISLSKWMDKHQQKTKTTKGKVYLFNDEFLDVTDSHIGIKAILLLEQLGYEVVIPKHTFSGRTFLSKGLVKKAKKLANRNVLLLKDLITNDSPLIGIEPSAILTFRDEYPELVNDQMQTGALKLAANALMFDEFFIREVEKGNILSEQFTTDPLQIRLHGHCHQKALATTKSSIGMLQFPLNYKVDEIPSGCCGMAGSFGYEKEHYAISQKIGELVLFPVVRKTAPEVIIAAPGASCREQIEHGTGRKALHPVEVIYGALK